MVRAGGRRRAVPWLLLVALCVAMAGVWLGIAGREGADRTGAGVADREGVGGNGTGNGSGAPDGIHADDGGDGVLAELLRGSFDTDAPVRETGHNRFLQDVARAAGDAASDEMGVRSACVQWREKGDIPQAIGSVLREYERQGGSWLVASGYVDLYGNVWCGLVRGSGAWADVVMATTEDGAESVVRVMRSTYGEGE